MLAISVAAAVICLEFVGVVLQHTEFGLPIEDGYIYLSYAKQFGRAQPFTYYPGGGYSAGSTSVIWPMLLAPFWALGARGVALVWVSFALCSCLYTSTAVLCSLIVRRLSGSTAAVIAGGVVLGIAPFAFTALSGMEVALASTLLLATTYQLFDVGPIGPPTKKLSLTLACLSLSRPESTLVVLMIVAIHVWLRVRRREWRTAALWAVPLVAPFLWVLANRVFAGNWFPNTGVAKSHFYLPGFDWTYWWESVTALTKDMCIGLFWRADSPFVFPRILLVFWLIGAVRVFAWAFRGKKLLVGVLLVFAPIGLILAVIGSSGSWTFHNYRYISSAFPLLIATAACGVAPALLSDLRRGRSAIKLAWNIVCGLLLVGFSAGAYGPMRDDMELYAQNVTDLNKQVVTLGHYIHENTPGAYVMFHDAGAIAYYGDGRVYDMLGLVTNNQARVANNGPGSRFEYLESLEPDARPTHFAYYPGWMGQSEFFGDVLLRTPLGPAFHRRRLIGDYDMQLIAARWDHVHTAEEPLAADDGWRLVDRVDVADLESEKAHAWTGALGRRRYGDPTARWSVFHKDERERQLLLDGGRTIRGGSEQFSATVDPTKRVRLIMRTGGNRSYAYNEAISEPTVVSLFDGDDTLLGEATLPAPVGAFIEVSFEFSTKHSRLRLATRANRPYRVFHWFVLQPR